MPSSDPPARRALRYEKAILTAPRPGRETSGDSCLVRELGDGRLLLALSDGMGSGPRAALQSATAVTLLERLLQAAFPPETAVRMVNATLLLRAPDEAFAVRVSWGRDDTLVIYRSLTPPARRAFLGHLTTARFLVGKFTSEGIVEPILSVE
jgi:hypothetical protein